MGLLGSIPIKSTSSIDDQFVRSGTREFLAGFTTDCDENAARSGLGIAINDPHPSDNLQVVTQISVDQIGERSKWNNPLDGFDPNNKTDCYYWQVQITYGGWDPLEHTVTGNPVDQPINFSFNWQVFEVPIDVDFNGVPIINSAQDPYDPPVTRDQLRGIIKVSQNVLSYNPAVYFDQGNSINTTTWNGFAAKTVKFTPPNLPERLWSQAVGQLYYRVEYEFIFDPKTWDEFVIDRGYRYLNGSGKQTKILDINGQPISQPYLLDGSGNVLLNPTKDNVVINQYQKYPDIEFNSIFADFSHLFLF